MSEPARPHDQQDIYLSRTALEQQKRWWSWWHPVELVATFLLFSGVMHFMYAGQAGTPANDIGVPGHDSFYHIKMAALMPEIGLVDTFPWLRTTVFNDKFVNHHYGFHLLLSPVVHLSHWLTGDYAAGGRWFMTVSFGVSISLFQLLLMVRRIERRWIWIALCLVLPVQFYGRHLFVRAINPSLICMLLLCLCMFTRRYLLAGIVVALSIHIYLGAVTFMPVLVAAMFAAGLVGLVGDLLSEGASFSHIRREVVGFDGWRLAAWTFGGWVIGLATHPYGGLEVLSFLKLQVFGSGLTPDIPVGREWKSYSPAWFFANMSGVTLTVTGIALCLRLRFGKRIRTDDLALLLINMIFLGLTLKARRFIEYWPLFATLSAAYLAGPLLGPRRRPAKSGDRSTANSGTVAVAVTGVIVVIACLGAARLAAAYVPNNFTAEWRMWTWLAGLCALTPITRAWWKALGGAAPAGERAIIGCLVPVSGVTFCAVVAGSILLLGHGEAIPPARFLLGWRPFAALLLVYALCGAIVALTTPHGPQPRPIGRILQHGYTVVAAIALACVVVIPAGALFGGLQRKTRCAYDLPAVRKVMAALESESAGQAVVFTCDWDIFPVYFYLNHRDHYVVGLDPKFSHEKDPVLWERYVRISRGETPATRRVKVLENGKVAIRRIDVELTDIRDHFHADFVVVDRDHQAFAKQLDRAPALARRIFPREVPKGTKPPYFLYRVLR